MDRHEGDLSSATTTFAGGVRDRVSTEPPVKARVLFIDDEVALGITLDRALGDEHAFVLETSASDALERLRDDVDFDIVLCDLMLPDLSGMDFHRELARLHPGMEERVVFVTGGAFSPAAQRFLEAVSNRCIEKPFDLDVLEALLRDFAARRRDGRR